MQRQQVSEYERAREEALEMMNQAEERKMEEENKKREARCRQMVELKLREDEVCGVCSSCF